MTAEWFMLLLPLMPWVGVSLAMVSIMVGVALVWGIYKGRDFQVALGPLVVTLGRQVSVHRRKR